jgi:hypothetical protein
VRLTADFDDHGRTLNETVEQRRPDGIIEYRVVSRWERNERGQASKQLDEFDDGADGAIDFRARTEWTRDAAGRVLLVDEAQTGADGDLVWRQLTQNEYDASGRIAVLTQSTDFDGDGVAEHVATQRADFDGTGNLAQVRLHVRDGRPGGGEGRHVLDFTYDADRRPLTESQTADDQADGVTDRRTAVTHVYDADGMPARRDAELSDPASGRVHRRITSTWQHGTQGELLAEFTDWDLDGDGTVESQAAEHSEYDPVDDALGQVVATYFTY